MEAIAAGSLAVVDVGTTPQHLVIPAIGTLLVDPILLLPAVADATGDAKFSLSLPELSSLLGVTFYAQGAADVTGTIRLSNGVLARVSR